jgi:hypothetical protein
MTKKDFALVAATIKEGLAGSNGLKFIALGDLAYALAAKFFEAYPLFNKATFLTACGLIG